MDKKKCRGCGEEKPLAEFYTHKGVTDGHLSKCKECVKARVRKYREENIDKIRAYDRERGSLPKRVKARKEYAQTEAGKEALRSGKRAWNNRNPEKRAANTILGNAIRDGKIKKRPCEVCGSVIKIHGHHDDYTKPLDVKWLCPKHHSEYHKRLRDSRS